MEKTQKDMKKGERKKKHKNGDPRQCNCAKKKIDATR